MVNYIVDLTYVRTSPDGKSGLEVLMLIIEHSLLPTLDESQRIVAGPLIADLVRKVPLITIHLTYVIRPVEKCNLIYQPC